MQVGTAYAYCAESGMASKLRHAVQAQVKQNTAEVKTDALASPTGFPFKVVQLDGTLSSTELRGARERFPRSGWCANNLAFMLELQVRLGRSAPDTLAEGVAALRAAAPYAKQRFASGDLLNRAARLEYWAEHGEPRYK